jgi:hypothetical protein
MSEAINLETGQSAPRFSCLDSVGNKHELEQYMADGKKCYFVFLPQGFNTWMHHTSM